MWIFVGRGLSISSIASCPIPFSLVWIKYVNTIKNSEAYVKVRDRTHLCSHILPKGHRNRCGPYILNASSRSSQKPPINLHFLHFSANYFELKCRICHLFRFYNVWCGHTHDRGRSWCWHWCSRCRWKRLWSWYLHLDNVWQTKNKHRAKDGSSPIARTGVFLEIYVTWHPCLSFWV